MKNSVSAIIPTHNRSALVARAIQSVLAATRPGDEILVIDDGSTDDTAAAVAQFGDAVRYVRIDNAGPGAARNVGIGLAQCPLVAFLDSDDQWTADKLELQRTVMEADPSLVFCFGNMYSTLPSGEIAHDCHSDWRSDARIGSEWAPHLREVLGPAVRYSTLGQLSRGRADFDVHVGDMYPAEMEAHYVHSDAVLVRKDLAGPLLRYPEDVRLMEDYECFARLARVGPAAYLDCELADLTVHHESRLTDVDELKHATARIRVLERIWGADEAFLRSHSTRYRRVLAAKHRRRAKLLIAGGHMKTARAELKATGGPLSYQLIASLPPQLVQNALRVKRTALALLK